ncbi:MAG: FAD-dependent thymidylate synthase [Candidatus Micrarchaeia archaeon]|jgi:thymidylate synthase ThyX
MKKIMQEDGEIIIPVSRTKNRVSYIGKVDSVENQMKAIAKIMNCHSSKGAQEEYIKLVKLRKEKGDEIVKNKMWKIIDNSLGKGHNAVGDQIIFELDLKNIPRLSTLSLAAYSIGHSLMQVSTRFVQHTQVEIPISILKNKNAKMIFYERVLEAMEQYKYLCTKDYSLEDIIFITPLYLLTNTSLTSSARGLWQLFTEWNLDSAPNSNKKIANEIKNLVIKEYALFFREQEMNYHPTQFYPSSTGFLLEKNLDFEEFVFEKKDKVIIRKNLLSKNHYFEDKNTEASKFDEISFGIKIDISTMHELIRHKTIKQRYEPFAQAADRINKINDIENHFYIPPTFNENDKKIILSIYILLLEGYFKLLEAGIPKKDAIGILPHGMIVKAEIILDAWNLMHLSGERLCATAKPSFREIMIEMKEKTKKINPKIAKLMAPKCEHLGYCPEGKKNFPCIKY